MEKKTRNRLPVGCLFQNPTVEKLSKYVLQTKKSTKNKSLVPIKTKGSQIPLFIVSPGGASVYNYYAFGYMLDPAQPVYGLYQPIDIGGLDQFPNSIEDIATKYVAEILNQDPYGPYALSGQCIGGTIAFEMAKQIKAMGKR